MHIAVFDHFVTPNNPAGSCHRRLLECLCEEHDFTVFAAAFDNPRPDRIRFVRVPVIRRPLFLLFASYQLMSRLLLVWHACARRQEFGLLQAIESKGPAADVIYQHFCHRHFLRRTPFRWRPRLLARRINHLLHATLEGRRLRRAQRIVTPSAGLADEIAATWGDDLRNKTVVIPNPIDVYRFHPCDAEVRPRQRAALGLEVEALVLVFTALGDFDRKGLPILLAAIAKLQNPHVRLMVVGGNDGLVRDFRQRCRALGLSESQVIFTGRVADVRPFYWAADVFCLPSQYETFSLVAYEAAACGLPLLVTPLHGVEELVRDGENGWTVPADANAWCARIGSCAAHRSELVQMGLRAAEGVRSLGLDQFALRWNTLYLDSGGTGQCPAAPHTVQ